MYGYGVDALGDGPMYGPGVGAMYTDKATITAVQKKLKSLGFFPYTVDGRFGKDTNAAIFNYTATYGPPQNGPPDDALLVKLGLRGAPAISPAAQAMLATADKQAAQATTSAQLQAAVAQAASAAAAASAPPEARAQVAAAQQAAAAATTPAQVEAVKEQVQAAIDKVEMSTSPQFWKREAFMGLPVWQVAAGAGGTLAILGLAFLAFRPRAVSSKG